MEIIRRKRYELLFPIWGDCGAVIELPDPATLKSEALTDGDRGLAGHAFAGNADEFIKAGTRSTFTSWRHKGARIPVEWPTAAKGHVENNEAIATKVLQIAGELCDVLIHAVGLDLGLRDALWFWFKPDGVPAEPEALTGAMPRKLSNRLLRKTKAEEILRFFEKHLVRAGYGFYLRWQKSAGALGKLVSGLTDEIIEGIDEAPRSAALINESSKEGVASTVRQLDDRKASLEANLQQVRRPGARTATGAARCVTYNGAPEPRAQTFRGG